MLKGPSHSRSGALSVLIHAVGKFAQRLIPATPADRSIEGPVVFRHYL